MKLRAGMLIATCGFVSASSLADTVVLHNGDRLSDAIVKMEATSLWLDTSYAGKIKLPWAQVKQIESDKPVLVRQAGEKTDWNYRQ